MCPEASTRFRQICCPLHASYMENTEHRNVPTLGLRALNLDFSFFFFPQARRHRGGGCVGSPTFRFLQHCKSSFSSTA